MCRLKKTGGHNGLRDIIAALGSPDFIRMRIGIDHPKDRNQVTDYVLNRPNKSQQKQIEDSIADGLRVLPDVIAGNLQKAMQELHS